MASRRKRTVADAMNTVTDSPLGKPVAYADRYDATLLFAIPRAPSRAALGLAAATALPFHGVDIWNAYEMSWLDARGKPEVALAEFRILATSPNLIESKSFKLYLNSFNQERLPGIDDVRARLIGDLGAASGGDVVVALTPSHQFAHGTLTELQGESIDDIALDIDDYGPPNRAYLKLAAAASGVEEALVSHLLKSNCPITGQPDWASIQICYAGPRIDRAGLLRYLVSFRNYAGFHEHCVERIFVDLMQTCAPSALGVYARYTRRGGLDINPWRATHAGAVSNAHGARQ